MSAMSTWASPFSQPRRARKRSASRTSSDKLRASGKEIAMIRPSSPLLSFYPARPSFHPVLEVLSARGNIWSGYDDFFGYQNPSYYGPNGGDFLREGWAGRTNARVHMRRLISSFLACPA